MKKETSVVGVRLSPGLIARVEALTNQLAKSSPLGRPKNSDVLRSAIEHGIEAIAKREGFNSSIFASSSEKVHSTKREKKSLDQAAANGMRPWSVARAARRAQERAEAGCTCNTHSHVKTCKLYKGKA